MPQRIPALVGLQLPNMSGALLYTWPAQRGHASQKSQLCRSGRAGWRRSRWRCRAWAEPSRRRWRSLWRCRAARARLTRTCRRWHCMSGRRCAAHRPRRCVSGTWALGTNRTLEGAELGAESVVRLCHHSQDCMLCAKGNGSSGDECVHDAQPCSASLRCRARCADTCDQWH